MDFYFQSGEFIGSEGINWLELLATILSAFIGALGAYMVAERTIKSDREDYQQQLADNKSTEEQQESQRKKEKLLYFVWLLEQIFNTINEQNKNYKGLYKQMKANELAFHKLISQGSYDHKRLVELNQEEIFQAYVKVVGLTDENRNFIRELYSKIDFLDGVTKEVFRLFQSMHLEVHAMKIQYQNYLEEIREEVAGVADNINSELGAARVTDPLWKFLNKALVDYNKTMPEDADVDWHHPNFLRPLQETLVKEFINKVEVKPIVIKGRRASVLASRIKFSTSNMADTISAYMTKIDKVLAKLEEDITVLKDVLM